MDGTLALRLVFVLRSMKTHRHAQTSNRLQVLQSVNAPTFSWQYIMAHKVLSRSLA